MNPKEENDNLNKTNPLNNLKGKPTLIKLNVVCRFLVQTINALQFNVSALRNRISDLEREDQRLKEKLKDLEKDHLENHGR